VYVLVVEQSSSEVPEGLTNNPVYLQGSSSRLLGLLDPWRWDQLSRKVGNYCV